MNGQPIWKNKLSIDALNKISEHTLQQHLNIRFTEVGDNYLVAEMPVDWKCHQPYGILHGGASVVLAETTGSMAAHMCVPEDARCVGLDVNANHIRSVTDGTIRCVAKPLHIGSRTQVWEMTINNEKNQTVCQSRLTILVLSGKNKK